MKQYPRLMICFLFVFIVRFGYGQQITEQQAKEMAKRMMTMTPSQMMKFKDSLINAVMKQQAKTLPNGNQLLVAHHYDTTYTTVSFNYTKKTSQNFGGTSGFETYLVYGKSSKAPMIYEANGHTIVKCNMNMPGANTDAINKMAKDINSKVKYMKPQQAVDATDNSRQMAFASLAVNDNSLTGVASDNGLYSGGGGNTIITTKPPVKMMSFYFSYDPVEVLSSVAVGAEINRHTVSSHGATPTTPAESHSTDDTEGLGLNASTNPKDAKLVGGVAMQGDPDGSFITVTKTPGGFKIQYTRVKHNGEDNSDVSETLTATIGEPDQKYVAIIKPMPASKYEQWIPKGPKVDGSDDAKGDDSAKFYVEVHDKTNPNKLYPGNFTVKYQLKDVTHYKGFNSNYPVYTGDHEPDLKMSDTTKYFSAATFDPASVTDSTATSQPNNGRLAIVQIMCMDYGAWGKLTAEVTLDDGSVINASPYYDDGETFITIPYDRDENKIADAWEKKEGILHKGYGLDWDEDVKPDNKHNGDNIPLIDEYRGFLIEDENYKPVYRRFSPQVKELITIGLANMSNNGETYKAAIKLGALGYSKCTQVKVYHFTNSRYGQKEEGSSLTYGRWVNYNSPSNVHTHGVVIFAADLPCPRKDPDNVFANTGPTFSLNPIPAGYEGGQVPDDTDQVQLWTYNIINTNDFTAKAPSWYLPLRKEGNDNFNKTVNTHLMHTNAQFHTNFDPNTFGNIVAQHLQQNIRELITFTIAHEICHATGIHHHHFELNDPGSYLGAYTCPLRYWADILQEDNHADWIALFLSGTWNPATMTTPYDPLGSMSLCTTGDNCFSQLRLKRE